MRYLPAVLGAALLIVGAGLIVLPAGFIVAGVLLLALDRRL